MRLSLEKPNVLEEVLLSNSKKMIENNLPKISIIIPTRNEEKIIGRILKNVSSYTGKKEIIVTDGGSTDRTIEIAKEYTDKVVVYSGTKRQTIGGGRNAGVALASGKYLVFLDADTRILNPDLFFQKTLEVFAKNKNLVALTGYLKVEPESERPSDKIIFGILNSSYIFWNNILSVGGASGEFQMIDAEAFKKVGGYNEKLINGEDWELFRRLARVGKTHFEKNLTVYHTGRRGHKLGWVRFAWLLITSLLPVFIRRLFIKEWKEVR